MPIVNNLFEKYKNTEYFFESGSHVGDGIQRALDAGFTNIISVELAPNYFYRCILRFKDNKNVNIQMGDTEDVLEKLISPINEPITFWLDGHNSGYDTAWGKHESPLMQELEIIKRHPIKTHTLIIDDLRCWEKPHYDFDKEDILSFVKSINPDYEIDYEDGHVHNDIMVAYIKK
jgi:hypothetical protein